MILEDLLDIATVKEQLYNRFCGAVGMSFGELDQAVTDAAWFMSRLIMLTMNRKNSAHK